MTTLTYNEGVVVDIVRRQARQGDPVAAHVVRSEALDSYSVRYDSVNTALTGLVKKGLLSKPSRGYYLPTDGRQVA